MSPEPMRILVVDDDPGDFEMTRAMIAAGSRSGPDAQVEWASTWEEAMDAFERRGYNAYLVDYILEDRDGLALVRAARERGVREPVIMLTGRGSHEVDVEAMEAGASDYLVKERIDPDLLERTLRYALERYRAAEALRKSEERHRGMFDHLPLGLYRCSPDGGFMDANPALVRLLGHPDSETLRDRYASSLYVAPEDHEAFLSALRASGVVRGFGTTLERPDGTSVRVVNTARLHRAPDGGVEYVEGAVEDITELEAAKRLRGEAERFDVVYERSRLAILLLGPDGRIVDANPAFCRIFDYRGDDLAGRNLLDLAASSDRSLMKRDLAALTEGNVRGVEGQRRLVAGDGTVLWARVQTAPVAGSDPRGSRIMVLLDEVAEGAGEA